MTRRWPRYGWLRCTRYKKQLITDAERVTPGCLWRKLKPVFFKGGQAAVRSPGPVTTRIGLQVAAHTQVFRTRPGGLWYRFLNASPDSSSPSDSSSVLDTSSYHGDFLQETFL